jgi:hypothetical protein
VTAYFRVTVEDIETGESSMVEVAEGDYLLVPFGSCYLDGVTQHANGTVQLTIKGHRPAGPPRPGGES